MKKDRWYCFTCKEWHDKNETCYPNYDHYGIWSYDDFWEFIRKHKEALEEALETVRGGSSR